MAGQLKGESFGQVKPGVNIQRSTFDLSHTHKFTRNSGELIPFFWEEVIAGDTFKVDTKFVMRMLTPVVPVMDNAFLDIFYFFVPARLAFNQYGKDDHLFQKVFGQNDTTAWAPASVPMLPSILQDHAMPTDDFVSLGSYLGLPRYKKSDGKTYLAGKGCSVAPAYCYQTIWNNFFRDENLWNPSYLDADEIVANRPMSVCKLHDLFTSALPAPQKGSSVAIFGNFVPVDTNTNAGASSTLKYPIRLGTSVNSEADDGTLVYSDGVELRSEAITPTGLDQIMATNLGIDRSKIDVNALRLAFADQRLKERDARGGTRFNERLAADYQVYANYAALNIPEYLCGSRTPVNLDTVLQTSATTSTGALGDTGAFSNTFDKVNGFVKSFTEPGFVMGLCCVRTMQSYAQGIDKRWKHLTRDDFYNPVFANIGEQPIRKSELMVTGNSVQDDSVFGYQEAWYEYRYHKNELSGFVDPNYHDQTLSKWTYYEPFKASPSLGADFIKQDSSNIGDTLVQTDTKTQFICDFGIDEFVTRPMPVFSIPGLLDHN